MSDLKTLEDFESVTINAVGHINRNELKQEAIKDLKSFGSGKTLFFKNGEDISASEACAVCEYIKCKFNITEEDLA